MSNLNNANCSSVINDSSDDCYIIESSNQNIIICLDDTSIQYPENIFDKTLEDGEIRSKVEPNQEFDENSFYDDFLAGFDSFSDSTTLNSYTTYLPYDSISDDSFICNDTTLVATVPKEKRMIVIDGSNVAFNHSNNLKFSVKGLSIAIDFFIIRGYEVKAIVQQFRMKRNMSTDQRTLEILQQQGTIILTPAKNLPGPFLAANDDRFILEIAEKFDAALISNKNYLDFLNEKPEWKELVDCKKIGYSWRNDMFFIMEEPYGEFGPKLEDILFREKIN